MRRILLYWSVKGIGLSINIFIGKPVVTTTEKTMSVVGVKMASERLWQ